MFKKVLRLVFAGGGMILGYGVFSTLQDAFPSLFESFEDVAIRFFGILFIFLFGIIFLLVHDILEGENDVNAKSHLLEAFEKVPPYELFPSIAGAIVGVLIAGIFANLFVNLQDSLASYVVISINVLLYAGFGYYGFIAGKRFGASYFKKFGSVIPQDFLKRKSKNRNAATPKVLDTSVIIDGRIQEILRTGFIEGDIIIPDFVLVELRHISDSADSMKRVRGRRGLDILNTLQEEYGIKIYDTTSDKDLKRYSEVDMKLLKLTQKLGGMLITNDYNLNRAGSVEEIGILNINELANTLKPVSIPGEIMMVTPVKEGKNSDQSVAYLDDGTMIVVQEGREYIGRPVEVFVTSVLQTSAGRMIFVKPKEQ